MESKTQTSGDDFSDESSDDAILALISRQPPRKKESIIYKQGKDEQFPVQKKEEKKEESSDSDSSMELFASKQSKKKSIPQSPSSDLSDVKIEKQPQPNQEQVSSSKASIYSSILQSTLDDTDSGDDVLCVSSRMNQFNSLSLAKRVTRQSARGSSDILMFSKRILFTYQSPYINSSVDITEYDKVGSVL